MLDCEIDNIYEFKNLLIGVSKIVNEIQLEFRNEGLFFQALDESHINFIQSEVLVNFFSEYSLDEPFNIIIDTSNLSKILKRLNSKDRLRLVADVNELKIMMISDGTRVFTIKTISKEYTKPEMPVIEYTINDIEIPLQLLSDSVKDSLIVDKRITFQINEEYFKFRSRGMFNTVAGEYLHGEHVNDNVESSFSIDNIEKLISLNVGDYVSLSMSNDSPLCANIKNVPEDLSLTMLIAPRIEAE